MSKKKKIKKRKISKKKIFIFLFIITIIIFIVKLFNSNITNIYIKGNKYLTDQEIMDIAKLSEYPNTINNFSLKIKKRLENNIYIYKAKIRKNLLLNKVYIEIEENYPLFYSIVDKTTILYNGETVDDNLTTVTITNSVPDEMYDKFFLKIKQLDMNILNRISEIKYKPNDILKERFFLLMNDGNYVYITLDKFLTLNKYLDIIKSFNNKKGILYLDSGEYFDVFE